jgi:Carboxypeptidase regulatory-like domain/TonB dependent receptor
MRNVRTIITSLLVTGCLIGLASTGYSQGTNLGTIRGSVTDPNGAVVPRASVQVTDVETNATRDVNTNSEGSYEVTNLKPGTYTVAVKSQGFRTLEVRDVVVRGSEIARADAQLQIGVSETVNITSAPVIETDTATVSNTIDNRQLIEVPRDSRDIYEFLYLNPNITQGNGGDGSFKFIGAQSYGASFSVDGQRSNGGIFSEPTASQPSLETIGELTVLSNNFTAEYAGIANIRVVTKRGGKNYHGSLFYNNKNSAVAARSLDDKNAEGLFIPDVNTPKFPTPYFNLNELGGSFSGPIPFSKKTFFLASYERRWDIEQAQFRSTTMPSQRIILGDFSQLVDARKPPVPAAILPQLTAAELAQNTILTGSTRRFMTIPQRLINPVTSTILQKYYPTSSLNSPVDTANGRLLHFFQNVNGLATRNLGTFRLDHNFTNRDSVYAVYNISNANGSFSPVNALPALGLQNSNRTNHTLSLSYSRVFSANLVNELRGGFNKQHLFRRANQTLGQFLSGVGFDQSDLAAYSAVVGTGVLDLFGQPRIDLNGYTTLSDGGRSADRRQDQDLITFGDTLNWIHGRHSVKLGADFVRNGATDGFVQNRNSVRGRIRYLTSGTVSDNISRFLLGRPADRALFVQQRRGILDVTNWEQGYFFQDDFKLRPRLTLYLGLRYELVTPFIDKNNLMVNFDPNFVDPKTGRHGRFVVPTADVIQQIDPGMVAFGVAVAKDVGVGRGLLKTDRNNFAPRLGAAFRLNEKTVLRGGYGMFYPTAAAQGARDAFESSPFNQGREKRVGIQGWPGGINGRGISPLSGGTLRSAPSISVNAIPFDLQQPRIEQFNFTVERELGWNTGIRVSYLGTRMHGTIGGIDLNELKPSNTPFATTVGDGVTPCDPLNNQDCDFSGADLARRPFPELGDFLASYGNFGQGHSHALQIELNRRFVKGFALNASYTLLDQKSNGLDVAESSLGGQIYNFFNPNQDFSRDSFISRHRFIAYATYDLPFGHGRQHLSNASRATDLAVGGWQVSTNLVIKSGTGFTPYWTCDDCDPVWPGNIGSGFVEAVGDFGDSSYRPRVIGNPYSGIGGGLLWNPAAFAPPSVGADALDNGAKRNSLIGPSVRVANLSVRKNFKLTEKVNLNLGAMFDNIFNHPLFAPIDLEDDIARIGSFSVEVDQTTGKLLPIKIVDLNPNFGQLNRSFKQEGFDNRRSIRWTLRLTF